MFSLHNRRYTGSKTKLLESIDEALIKHFDYRACENLSFFDVFAGTGVVSEYFIQKKEFSHLIINDFLESNFVIYKAFFSKESFDTTKLESYTKAFNELNLPLNSKKYSHKTIEKDFHTSLASPTNLEALQDNYYSLNFGNSFFSLRDSKKIGFIREELDNLLESKKITKQEFTILLASLLYSVDRIANTVGHYDAYRKNVRLQDRFIFMLIKPLTLQDKNVEIYKKDSNILAKQLGQAMLPYYTGVSHTTTKSNKADSHITQNLQAKDSIKRIQDSLALSMQRLENDKKQSHCEESFYHSKDNQESNRKSLDSTKAYNDTIPIKHNATKTIHIAFLDPPYNSRQYSRFYHLLETLTLNTKPKLYGIAKKPEVNNMSEYCKVGAKEALKDLLDSLKTYTRYIVMTYNNTRSANARSNTRISLNDIQSLLEAIGTTHIHEYNFKAFNSGKTDTKTSFKEHKEYVFVCEVKTK
ncbi:DNA adenine methylase [uncultured Campylobacter sp.]|uniref:DNA adenine methylase n=1 Tax=uncultured Campylobacter sp. TaxID=218934 RepID=UPI00261D898A|nr:DNA adenine methylase [uncultured Campylobacter sp.]